MDKKNTILLTVIAVATLLVAVVGASFAFFAVQETNTADVKVETSTAKGSDIFTATGTPTLSLSVTNDKMQKLAGKDSPTDEELTEAGLLVSDNSMKVTLKAGTGKATCTYKLAYTSTGDVYTKTTGADKEYTLTGTDGTQGFAETNMDALANTLAAEDAVYTITNEASANEATEQTWTFTAKFYNLTINQGAVQGADGQVTSTGQLNKNFAGSVKVTEVKCSNEAVESTEQN